MSRVLARRNSKNRIRKGYAKYILAPEKYIEFVPSATFRYENEMIIARSKVKAVNASRFRLFFHKRYVATKKSIRVIQPARQKTGLMKSK